MYSLVKFFCFNFSFKTSESLKLLTYPLSGRNDAAVLYQVTDTLKHYLL